MRGPFDTFLHLSINEGNSLALLEESGNGLGTEWQNEVIMELLDTTEN